MEIKCPKCSRLFDVTSNDFGNSVKCPNCSNEFVADTDNLPKYELPDSISVQLVDGEGNPVALSDVVVYVEYGFPMPPLKTNSDGIAKITKEMFQKAEKDQIATGIMDHKGDYSLNRFVKVSIYPSEKLEQYAKFRKESPWGIFSLEKEMYGDLDNLISSVLANKNAEVNAASEQVDLESNLSEVILNLQVK